MPYPDCVPVLTDGVVTLRSHIESDIKPMTQMCQDPEFARWTSVPQPYDTSNARSYVEEFIVPGWERHHRGWAIEYDGKFAGNIDVRGEGVADVGFGLHPDARGHGVMTRALRLATRWAFDNTEVEIVHWRARVGNVASLRAAWAAGFTLHGTSPGFLYEREQVFDAWTGSIRPEDDGTRRTPWWSSPVLRGTEALLRPFRGSDAPRIAEACSDPETRQWIPVPAPYTEDVARTYLASSAWNAATGSMALWAIADPDSDALLGNIAVLRMDDRTLTGEIGYWMHPDARGRGVMTEATRLVMRHALTPVEEGGLGRRRLKLNAAAGNVASNAIALTAGFTHVGTLRDAELLGDGTYADLNAYDLLA
ncbi:MAG: GNAT family N-acetyltransferase [Actinomycetia bacterium]|nr:GNAT family N-acetyltransferase [Actinomycetes bacterium]